MKLTTDQLEQMAQSIASEGNLVLIVFGNPHDSARCGVSALNNAIGGPSPFQLLATAAVQLSMLTSETIEAMRQGTRFTKAEAMAAYERVLDRAASDTNAPDKYIKVTRGKRGA